ncbi:MAG: UvrD-helicase domain-containing protein [Oscillospiraceae bacterium]|nr:UvrD-helicase domain-containing protein [Oscillospiraceae bacterium]
MNKEELLREIIELETRVDFLQNDVLSGTFIAIKKYGVVEIQAQDEYVTLVNANGVKVIFNSLEIGKKFVDKSDVDNLKKRIDEKRSILNDGKSPAELIEIMLSRWSQWDKYEEEYLNKVAYDLVKYPEIKTNDDESAILEELKRKLSEEDWNNLPVHIADIHYGRKLKLTDSYESIASRITEEVREQIYDELKSRTVSIINCIISEEEAAQNRESAINRLQQLLKNNYLGACTAEEGIEILQCISDKEFDAESEAYVRNWFVKHQSVDEQLPDREQIAAISTRNKNVEVVARAGSGKTTTIISRTQFLIEHCGVDPSAILLLAFNRKAVEEMEERLIAALGEDKLPFVMTFHALAYSIVHPEEELIYDDPETNEGTLSRVVQTLIDKRIRDKAYVKRIRNLMLAQFKDEWRAIEEGGYNLSRDEMIVFRKALKNRTMAGEIVQSDIDKIIANVLFEHDVPYKYRWSNNGKNQTTSYFIVNAPNNRFIVIEALGSVDGNNKSLKKKQDYWRSRKGCRYFVLRSDIVKEDEDSLIEILAELFRSEEVPFYKLSDEEIWRRIRDRAIGLFTDAVRTFIGRCRKLEITPFTLAKMVRNHDTINETEKQFLDIAQDLYKDYLSILDHENLEDFDGLMSRASAYVNDGRHVFKRKGEKGLFDDLEHILIDEYQDFSYLFDNFLVLIREICPDANIFCVGDDWQAINGFAGSDVKYFTGFLNRYEDSKRYHISTNYRSVPHIVKSSNALMARFSDGTIVGAARSGNQRIRVGYCADLQLFPQEERIFYGRQFPAALLRLVNSFVSYGKSVAVLSRTNKEIEGLEKHLQSFFSPDKQKLISVSTTHKYKGKQKDSIIVMDAEIGKYPLINPAWIFNRIFGDTEQKILDDERRLFYVAVTRAKDDLILLTTHNEESPFLNDMPKMTLIDWDEFPPMNEIKSGDATSHVKVTVSNRPGYRSYPYPTVKIKDLLKKEKYTYDGNGSWYKFYPQTDNLGMELMQEAWATVAEGISVTIMSDDTNIIDSFTL